MDPKSPEFLKTMMELRTRAIAENHDVESQLKKVLDRNYWRRLNPDMTVCGEQPVISANIRGVDPSLVEPPLKTFFTSGYFELPAIVPSAAIHKMKSCFDAIQNAGWPTGFVFIYDEFWRVFREPFLARFLTGALGKGYRQLPYCWGHFVPPNSRGWRPHVDGPTVLPKLTVWLALTDATLENGCMYLVPRNSQTAEISDRFLAIASFQPKDAMSLLHNSKALPVAAGSCLG